ncbi:MAG: IPT/TIG domain-containing protein [Draconibacterium sp.]
MHTKFIKNINRGLLILAITLATTALLFTSCDDDDDDGISGVLLESFGPMPIARGAELRFIGINMDQVTSVVLPSNIEITDFNEKSSELITLTVPQNAVPGIVTLKTPDGDIITKTPISYSEPISIASFSPTSIKPGQEITITGDYLNLVKEVLFTDRVALGDTSFTAQSRKELKLIVPAEAQSGKIAVSNGAEDPIIIYSTSELAVALPAVTAVAPNPVKAGTTLTITGTNLDLVKTVKLGDKTVTEFTDQSETSLALTVPADTKDGAVTLEVPSGIEITAGDLALVVPTAAIEDMKDSYGVDETVVISGTDLDLVTTATFTGAEAAPVTITDGKLNLNVMAAAQSGPITLTMANGTTVIVDGFETTKPVATFPSDATPLDELNIVSTLGNRVKTVMFGDLEAEATATGDGFSVIVPLEAETGNVTLMMDNGETVDLSTITINAYTFCAVAEFAEETTTIGDLLKCSVVNGSNLTEVRLNDSSTDFILNGNILFVSVGRNTGTQKITLVSNDGTEVNYDIEVVGAGIVETVLYDIPLEVNGWGGVNLPYTVELPLPANAKIRIRVAQANSELQVMDGYWGMGPNWAITDNAKKNVIVFSAEDLSAGYVDVDFSVFHDENDNPWWDGKMMFNADGVIVSSISLIVDYSAPTPIWEGTFDIGSWAGNQDLAWGGFDWSTVKAGQTLYFTFTINAGNEWGCLSLRRGKDWGNLPGAGSVQIDFGPSDTQGTYTLTQADIDELVANNGLVITGANLTLTKVALK